MSSDLERAVLSDAVREAVGGRRVRVALFVTYELDPSFFELQVLPLLFDRAFSHVENVRRVQLEEALRDVDEVAVYFDRHRVRPGTAALDWKRYGGSRRNGVFHAKHVLLLVDGKDDDDTPRLILVTTSANLTQAGWWENLEVAHIETFRQDERSSMVDDLRGNGGLLARLLRHDETGGAHHGIAAIRAFFRGVEAHPNRRTDGRWLPRLFAAGDSFAGFVREHVPHGWCLEIISPFFDDTERAATLASFVDETSPAETRVYLPTKDDVAQCGRAYFDAVSHLDAETMGWGDLPDALVKMSTRDSNAQRRFVHAKVYRFFSREAKREILFVGSVNLTAAAHSGRNFETAVMIERDLRGRPDWWMTRRIDSPVGFRDVAAEDEPPLEAMPPLTIRYSWPTGILSYFCEARATCVRATVSFAGVSLFTIDPITLGSWVDLPRDAADAVAVHLRSSAVVDIACDDGPAFALLVQEDGAHARPSMLDRLTQEEILQYWSLLSVEQRDRWMETHIEKLLGVAEPELGGGKADDAPVSMFNRFAGIFHAFSCLGEHIDAALEEKRDREAEYRFFGRRYDSLAALLDKVLESKGDPVNRYVTALCATELVERTVAAWPSFVARHPQELEFLRSQLARARGLRNDLRFGTDNERAHFLEWFETAFAAPVGGP